jgi:hypothetical protein
VAGLRKAAADRDLAHVVLGCRTGAHRSAHATLAGGPGFAVRLSRPGLRISFGPGSKTPITRTRSRPSAGGRSLSVVPALSTRWHWYLTREPAGRVIWCEIEA